MTTTDQARRDENPETLPRDELFPLLSNRRRRATLGYLNEHDSPVDMRDLAERIAACEHDKPVSQLRSKERQRVYIALYQTHLPKLDDCSAIEYDQSRGTVRRTALADQFDPYLDSESIEDGEPRPSHDARSTRSSIRSSLGVLATGIATLAVGWIGLLPVLPLLALTWIALFVSIFRPQPTELITATLLTER